MQFVLISLVILPVLSDQAFGPYAVVNPRQVWWMVVLIVGLNLVGYASVRLMGGNAGTVLAGVLGGGHFEHCDHDVVRAAGPRESW